MSEHASNSDAAHEERPEPLWTRTADPIPTDQHLPSRADVVVVGAGITGLTTGMLLARAGRRVTVVEARSVGAVTTGNSSAKLTLLQGTTLSAVQRKHDTDVLRAYVAANRAGQSLILDLVGPREASPAPAYTYARSAEGDDAVRREWQAAIDAGLDARLLTAADVIECGLPSRITSAVRLDAQAALHPLRTLARLAAELRSLGGQVVDRTRVTDVDLDDGGVRVRTPRGDIVASVAVLATGSPILDRSLFFAKIEPSRSLVAAYRLPAEQDALTLVPGMFLSADEPKRSVRTAIDVDGTPVVLVGGESFFPGRIESVRSVLDGIDAWTATTFPGSRRVTWWAAQDYSTFTGLPFAGPMPRGGTRIYAATGFAKWGMSNGPAAAIAIAGAITGDPPEWADVYSAHPSLGAVASAAGANSEIARRLAVGWAAAETSARVDDDAEAHGERIAHRGLAPVAQAETDGRVCRLSAVCTHLGGIVRWNDAEHTWDCPLHGSRFAASGEVLEGPAVAALPVVG